MKLGATVAATLVVLLLGADPALGSPSQQAASIELVDQTPSVARGDRWDVAVRTGGLPPMPCCS